MPDLPVRKQAEGNRPMPMYGIREDFPRMFEIVAKYDMAERLGGRTDPVMAEIDAALHELWDARRNLASSVALAAVPLPDRPSEGTESRT
jgi:hypothetical protein